MEEEKKLPKNIRQMAEKEERVRVYLEDYAYTFIRKLNCTGHVRTGILLGSKMVTENKRCWFVKGAVELEDAQGSTEEENEQKTAITQQVWDNTLSVIQEYFPGCSICGWFISGTEENFPDGEELKKTHRQIFSGENCLMYWKKGDEESFWMEEEDTILHLKGYFVYYEKNNEMQNYMLSRNADQSEDVSDQAALNFRKIMKEKQDIKHPQKSKHINQTPKLTAENGIWVKAGVAILFIILVGGGVLFSRGMNKKEDSVQALAVGASVERKSGESEQVAFESESEQIAATKNDIGALSASLKETENTLEVSATKIPESSEEKASVAKTPESSLSSSETEKKDVAAIQNGGIFSGDMMFYKDGLGASVYRITSSTEASKNEESDAASSEENESSTQEILTVAAPTLPTEENAAQGTSEAAEAAVNRPVSYTVQPGDTLIEISKKFYGSSQMVMQLKEVNGLDDINKIYIGQELNLP